MYDISADDDDEIDDDEEEVTEEEEEEEEKPAGSRPDGLPQAGDQTVQQQQKQRPAEPVTAPPETATESRRDGGGVADGDDRKTTESGLQGEQTSKQAPTELIAPVESTAKLDRESSRRDSASEKRDDRPEIPEKDVAEDSAAGDVDEEPA